MKFKGILGIGLAVGGAIAAKIVWPKLKPTLLTWWRGGAVTERASSAAPDTAQPITASPAPPIRPSKINATRRTEMTEPMDMTPPPELAPSASAVNAEWIEVVLPDATPYDPETVGIPGRYGIRSDDDPNFAVQFAPIAVEHRHWPEEARYASTPDAPNIAEIKITYRVFIRLPADKRMKEGKNYIVTLPGANWLAFAFDATNPAFRVNMEEYAVAGPKQAYLSAFTGQSAVEFQDGTPFELVEWPTGNVVTSGTILATTGADPWSGAHVYTIDFTAYRGEGLFYLRVPGVGRSFTFGISKDASIDLATTMLRGLMLVRDGQHGLTPAVTQWSRPPAHLDDAIDRRASDAAEQDVRTDLVGGHMDAGDRGHYPADMAGMCAAMLTGLELFPPAVNRIGTSALADSAGLPGVPDVVAELVYELDHLVKMANAPGSDGTLSYYLRPSGGGYEQGRPPEGEPNRILFNKPERIGDDEARGPYRAETLYGAGVLAWAATDETIAAAVPDRVKVYADAALRIWKGWLTHKDDPSWWADPNDTHAYNNWVRGPRPWSSQLLIAAANLWELTGDPKFAVLLRDEMPPDLSPSAIALDTWQLGGPWIYAFVSVLHTTGYLDDTFPALRAKARAAIIDWADATMQHDGQAYEAPFGVPLPWMVMGDQVGWFFSAYQTAFPAAVAYAITKAPKYRDLVGRVWNYLLGANALGRSYVTGLGRSDRRPRWPVNEIAQERWMASIAGDPTGWSDIQPGLLSADIQDGWLPPFFDSPDNQKRREEKFPVNHPPLLRFMDAWKPFDECTIDRQAAAMVSILALL